MKRLIWVLSITQLAFLIEPAVAAENDMPHRGTTSTPDTVGASIDDSTSPQVLQSSFSASRLVIKNGQVVWGRCRRLR